MHSLHPLPKGYSMLIQLLLPHASLAKEIFCFCYLSHKKSILCVLCALEESDITDMDAENQSYW